MNTYNQQLNTLFQEWMERSKANGERCDEYGNIIFTQDGIMEKNDPSINATDDWQKASKRVLFLIKDQPTNWSDDLRWWLKELPTDSESSQKRKQNNNALKSKFLYRIATILWGLLNASKDKQCTFAQVRNSFEQVKQTFGTYPFALVECKKQGGTTSISDAILQTYLNRYGDLLQREIQILQPNIIVCTSTIIYDFVQRMYPANELQTIEGHNSIRIHPQSGTIILCSFHPSGRISHETFYEGVMNHYRAYLIQQSK